MRKRLNKLLWDFGLLALLGFVPGIVAQTSPASRVSKIDRDFQAAMAAEDRGDLEQAETLLSTLHKEHPGIFAVDESLGLIYAGREDFLRALPLLQAAVHEQPSSDGAHANLGATFYRLHRDAPAREEFEYAVRINPRNLSAQESLGRLSMDAHRPDEAAGALLAALRLKPDDADLKLDCATALLAANRVSEARNMLSSFPDSDRSAHAQSLLGEADEKEGKFQQAGEHLARAVELEPSEENAWQLGYDFLRHWAFDAAITEFQAASAKFPDSKRLKLGLGVALFGDAKYAETIPVFADLLASGPDNAMYAELLGIACNGPLEVSSPRCAALVDYAQAHSADAYAATYAAASLMKHSDSEPNVDLARKLLERALARDPDLPEAQFEMGVVLQDSSDWKGSIPYLERALKLEPDFAQAHYRLARAYWRTGRKAEGQAQMDLQKKFARQEQEDLQRRLDRITSLAVTVQP